MEKIKIKLISLGDTKRIVDLFAVAKHKSKLFSIEYGGSIGDLPDATGPDWSYLDSQLAPILPADSGADLVLGITQAELEDNYYFRRLTDAGAVLSLYEIADMCRGENVPIENYVLRSLYEASLIFLYNGRRVPLAGNAGLVHHETRGCIFDMNPNKKDVLLSCVRPIVCRQCSAKLSTVSLPYESIDRLSLELSRIKKSMYHTIADWIKRHPVLSIVITILGAAFSSALGRAFYEISKNFILSEGG